MCVLLSLQRTGGLKWAFAAMQHVLGMNVNHGPKPPLDPIEAGLRNFLKQPFNLTDNSMPQKSGEWRRIRLIDEHTG